MFSRRSRQVSLQLFLQDLARGIAGKILDEKNLLRKLEMGDPVPDGREQRLFGQLGPLLEAVLLNSLIIIDKVSLFCGGRIRRRALFVKAILSQHVVSRYGAI